MRVVTRIIKCVSVESVRREERIKYLSSMFISKNLRRFWDSFFDRGDLRFCCYIIYIIYISNILLPPTPFFYHLDRSGVKTKMIDNDRALDERFFHPLVLILMLLLIALLWTVGLADPLLFVFVFMWLLAKCMSGNEHIDNQQRASRQNMRF